MDPLRQAATRQALKRSVILASYFVPPVQACRLRAIRARKIPMIGCVERLNSMMPT
jgi:hypothetical protein